MKGMIFGALAIVSAPVMAADKKVPPPAPSTEPNWAEVRQKAEALLTRDLYDPQAAQITWRGGWRWGHIKTFQLWSKREYGWLGCVGLNSKNRMGGYTGIEEKFVLLKPDGSMKTDAVIGYTSECDDGSPAVPIQAAFATPTNGGVGTTAPVSMADELAKLADLRAKGILTDDEFTAQKAKLLAR